MAALLNQTSTHAPHIQGQDTKDIMPATAAKFAQDLPEEFHAEGEDFASLFESSMQTDTLQEGNVVRGTIIAIEKP